MKATYFIAWATYQLSVLAAPTEHYVRHESRANSVHYSPWEKREAASPEADFVLPMRIGLTQSNLDRGHDLLMEVSDPRSSAYGKHYSVEEVHDLFAPSEQSVAAVRAWLEKAGIAEERVSQSINKQWLQFDAPVYEVEDLFKTQMHVYEHNRDGRMAIGCDEYHVHETVKDHIDYITPGLKLLEIRSDALRKRMAPKSKITGPIITPLPDGLPVVFGGENSNELQYCNTFITPNCIYAMYNITEGTSGITGNELGIFEETPEYLDKSDMNLFFANVYPRIPQGTFPIVKQIDGAKNSQNPDDAGGEALLDFQVSYPIIYPQQSILFLTDDAASQDNPNTTGLFNTFLDAIDGSYCTFSAFGETGNNQTVDPVYPNSGFNHPAQCGVFKPTNVISLSYELAEFNEGTPENYQKRQCLEYMKLGLQGVSLVFSSGDAGVASNWGCGVNAAGDEVIFNPLFPSNCPYVTSVGATALNGSAAADQETAVTQFPSGGGFSNFWPRPSYQDKAVEAFFKSPNAPTYPYYTGSEMGNGVYNRSGRGIPDVSAVGQNIVNFGQGEPYLVSSTLCQPFVRISAHVLTLPYRSAAPPPPHRSLLRC